MRKFATLIVALAAAVPAYAAPTGEEIVSALPHPYDVEAAGDRIGDAVGAIVDLPIGNVVRAIDPRAPVRRDDTIADVAGRDDPDFEEKLQDQVSGASRKAADMVRGLAASAPRLGRTLAELERSLDEALRGLRR